jgi:hypothetical protein
MNAYNEKIFSDKKLSVLKYLPVMLYYLYLTTYFFKAHKYVLVGTGSVISWSPGSGSLIQVCGSRHC